MPMSCRRLMLQTLSPAAHRSLSTSVPRQAALASSLPAKPTVLLSTPSQKNLEKEELDVDLIPPEQVKLDITDRAAEVSNYTLHLYPAFADRYEQQLMKIAQRENDENAALRVSVESGGCHGYQYKMELATSRSPDD